MSPRWRGRCPPHRTERSMFEDVLAFAALPLAAAIVFTGIHTWFGLQVLRRNVVFADLALAQISALGATVAAVAGHNVQSAAGYVYTLLFAAAEETSGFAKSAVWDAIFYLSFGLVVTSSVTIAGVLLVFCFLIVPAL